MREPFTPKGYPRPGELPEVPKQSTLGQMISQGFDYEAARNALLPPEKKRSGLVKALEIILPGLMSLSGNQAGANAHIQMLANRRQDRADLERRATDLILNWKHDDWKRKNQAYYDAIKPFTSGRDRVQYDPATGKSDVLYDGRQDFEDYASTLGLNPGSEEYFKAVEDYVLRSSGPSAHERDVQLDDHRTSNDEQLEGVRYGNRVRMENLRQGNRAAMEGVRQNNRLTVRNTPRPSRSAGGTDDIPTVKTPEEAMRLPSGTRFRTPDGKLKVVP
ncbi:hypothetical protein [Croceicoccus bisphenolivorans]|uniref:hypothetical protein n=1 Tax=Croceicoccus bisphenolivorans TaxID=1783232 RepID=UPI00082A6C68|nr:hypothetical protein [Croceicoccus bisphenolivorans]